MVTAMSINSVDLDYSSVNVINVKMLWLRVFQVFVSLVSYFKRQSFMKKKLKNARP